MATTLADKNFLSNPSSTYELLETGLTKLFYKIINTLDKNYDIY